jgi:molecular chaperone IbpA
MNNGRKAFCYNHSCSYEENKMTLKDINKYFLGFDEAQARINQLHNQMVAKANVNYPPYNIKRNGDHKYLLELAVAGFKKHEITIELSKGELVITAQKSEKDEGTEYSDWIHQGIAYRGFTRTFFLDNQYEVLAADLEDGLLKIYLGLQEDLKPKRIPIGSQRELLAA